MKGERERVEREREDTRLEGEGRKGKKRERQTDRQRDRERHRQREMAGGESRPISSFFSEDNNESDCRTFSQLLAGVMTSPETSIRGAIPWTPTFGEDLGGNVEALPVFPLTPGVSPGALLDTPSLLAPVPVSKKILTRKIPIGAEGIWYILFSRVSGDFREFTRGGTGESQR